MDYYSHVQAAESTSTLRFLDCVQENSIHWSIVSMWLVFHYSVAITTDFGQAK